MKIRRQRQNETIYPLNDDGKAGVMFFSPPFSTSYLVQLTANTWIGVILHVLINGPGFLAVALGGTYVTNQAMQRTAPRSSCFPAQSNYNLQLAATALLGAVADLVFR
jgi:hypothetical protein